jgi:hypothetical protein
MDESLSKKRSYADFSGGNSNEEKRICVQVPKERNAIGECPYVEEYLSLNDEDPFSLATLHERIDAKHAKNESCMLARVTEKIEDGILVKYFDAHMFNCVVFNSLQPLKQNALKKLDELSNYMHPISRESKMHSLAYYECAPTEKVFKLMCTYEALRSQNQDKRNFWRRTLCANQEFDLQAAAGAMVNLGVMYHKGEYVAIDHAKEKMFYEKAANQEYDLGLAARAMYNLGCVYRDGESVDIDCPNAMALFEKAANQTDDLEIAADAMYNLAWMHRHGEGVATDHEKAKLLFEKVAKQKHNLEIAAHANNTLGYMYQHGEGVDIDYAKAKTLYSKAVYQKHNADAAQFAKGQLAELAELMKQKKNG